MPKTATKLDTIHFLSPSREDTRGEELEDTFSMATYRKPGGHLAA